MPSLVFPPRVAPSALGRSAVSLPPYLTDDVLLQAFPVAAWAEVEATALLRRFDRKFVLTFGQLEKVLQAVGGKYRLLPSNGHSLATYDTTYFDTPDLVMFRQHARGKRPRFKVRIRHYSDRASAYLEVKQKTNRGETSKHRRKVPFEQYGIEQADHAFLQTYVDLEPATLRPLVSTHFKRLTLLNAMAGERVTSDVFLTFSAGTTVRELCWIAVIEVKQAKSEGHTAFTKALHAVSAQPRSFSKYSLGVASLELTARINAFVPTLRMIERLRHA